MVLANRRAANDGEARRETAWRNKEVENADLIVFVGCTLNCVFGVGSVLRRGRTCSVVWLTGNKGSGKIQLQFPASAE